MAEYDLDEVSLFLKELGYNKQAEKLRKEDISMDILREMTTDDLWKIGLTFGCSFQIRKALDKLVKPEENEELESRRSTTEERTDLDHERASDFVSEEESDETLPASSVPEKIKLSQHESMNTPTVEQEADEFVEMGDEVRIVLLGKTGNGRSATGNTILGREGQFTPSSSASSITATCKRSCSTRFKLKLHVVDTPGLFDTQYSNEDVQSEIVKCIHISAPGPHAFILVLGLARFSKEENDAVTHFVNHFGERIYDYFILLFTRRDELEYECKTLEDHLKTIPDNLKKIVEKCGKRCIAFNNRAKGCAQERQVKSLLRMIQANVFRNGQKYYTNSMYEEAAKLMTEREVEIKREMEDKRRREIDEMRREIEKNCKEEMKTQSALHSEELKFKQDRIDEIVKVMSKLENSIKDFQNEKMMHMDRIHILEYDLKAKDDEIRELLNARRQESRQDTR